MYYNTFTFFYKNIGKYKIIVYNTKVKILKKEEIMRKITIFNFLFIILTLFMLIGCNTPETPPVVEDKEELTFKYEEVIYYSQTGYIEVTSIYENDEIYFENSNEKVLKVKEERNGYYKIEALSLGEATLTFTSYNSIKEYPITINVDAKEGFAPPVEKIDLKIKEQGPYYVNETYHLEYTAYPEIYNDTIRYITNDDYEINQETNEIVFKHAGTFVVSIFANKKAVRTNITVDVEFPLDGQMYEILYIGNSLTYVHDIPSIIKNMIEADGAYISYCQDTPGGSYLKDHRNNFDILINKYDFTHVILQGQSYEAISNFNEFRSEILRYNQIIQNKNSKTNVILYQSWAYNRDVYNGLTKYEMTKKLADAYKSVATEINADITRSGEAFKLFETEIGLTPSLYQDMNHQSLYGAYLSACVHYTTITGRKASDNTYVISGIEPEMIKTIQKIADRIYFE